MKEWLDMKFFLVCVFVLWCAIGQAREVGRLDCTIDKVIDRTLLIEGTHFRPSGYATLLPAWLKEGSQATISFACDELGDCYYVDIAPINGTTPIGDKINANILEYKHIFPN